MSDPQNEGIIFVPCVKWLRQGVAKAHPEQVRGQNLTFRLALVTNLILLNIHFKAGKQFMSRTKLILRLTSEFNNYV